MTRPQRPLPASSPWEAEPRRAFWKALASRHRFFFFLAQALDADGANVKSLGSCRLESSNGSVLRTNPYEHADVSDHSFEPVPPCTSVCVQRKPGRYVPRASFTFAPASITKEMYAMPRERKNRSCRQTPSLRSWRVSRPRPFPLPNELARNTRSIAPCCLLACHGGLPPLAREYILSPPRTGPVPRAFHSSVVARASRRAYRPLPARPRTGHRWRSPLSSTFAVFRGNDKGGDTGKQAHLTI